VVELSKNYGFIHVVGVGDILLDHFDGPDNVGLVLRSSQEYFSIGSLSDFLSHKCSTFGSMS